MVFHTLLSQHILLSSDRLDGLICGLHLPENFILTRKSKLRVVLTSLLFKNYLHDILINKDFKPKYAIWFFVQLRTERGVRHLFNSPVNGQRSKTNANTQKRKGRVLSKNQLRKLAKAQKF